MGAFIAGGIIFVITVVISFGNAVLHADGERDDFTGQATTFIGGTALALIVVSSHWWGLSW